MKNSLKSVEDFYNDINDKYTDYILRCVPRYAEMQWAIMHYISNNLKPKNILEIGCGTGNLTKLILKNFPDANIHIVDISKKMIDNCKNQFQNYNNIKYHCNDFRDLDDSIQNCDLVLSSISIHHINDKDKKSLFNDIFMRTTNDAILCYSDQFSSYDNEIYNKNISLWENESKLKGASENEWKMWMQHQEDHDYHATLENQIKWLKTSGFTNVECVWRHLLWSVIIAAK